MGPASLSSTLRPFFEGEEEGYLLIHLVIPWESSGSVGVLPLLSLGPARLVAVARAIAFECGFGPVPPAISLLFLKKCNTHPLFFPIKMYSNRPEFFVQVPLSLPPTIRFTSETFATWNTFEAPHNSHFADRRMPQTPSLQSCSPTCPAQPDPPLEKYSSIVFLLQSL